MSTSTIVLTLAGPLQSWGSSQGTVNRRTGIYPTKSAVLGMIAGAQGRDRGESFADLNELSMTIRVDYSGGVLEDFHTAHTTKPSKAIQTHPTVSKDSSLSKRQYRTDAVYTVLLTGRSDLIKSIHESLLRPVYAPFLGRRSAVPSRPVYPPNSVIYEGGADAVIKEVPWSAPLHIQKRNRANEVSLVVVRDSRRREVPHGTVSDSPSGVREWLPRDVVRETVTVAATYPRNRSHHTVRHHGKSPLLPQERKVLQPSPGSHNPFDLIK